MDCPWCNEPVGVDEFMLRWRGQWHHPLCAKERAQSEGKTWSAGHPLAATLEHIVAHMDVVFSEPWCVCLDGTLDEEWHATWPVDSNDGEPFHYCPACRVLNPDDRAYLAYSDCPAGHAPPERP